MERKNIFDKNKIDRKKVTYYVIMVVCIAAITAISFISYRSVQNALSENKIDNNPDNVDKVDTDVENVKKDDQINEDLPENQPDENMSSTPSSENSETSENTSKAYIMPITGEITNGFSLTSPIYSKTLKDWRIHDGIDISGKIGDSVKCVNDGAIESIKSDDLYGITVVVKHTDGKKSIYCNLDDSIELEEGQIIYQGDIVGKIGKSAVFEISDGPHLHFEISQNGKKVDPLNIIKVQE